MATAVQIRDRAANDLGVLPLGQDLQPQDQERIEAAYDEVYAQLKADGLATWASTGEVPPELVPHVTALVARNCMNAYGVSEARRDRIERAAGKNGEIAMREIKLLVQPHYSSQGEAEGF